MRLPLPNEALYPVRVLAAAGCIYGVATVLSGSGFLAVLLAGILVGDVRAPYKREIEHVSASAGRARRDRGVHRARADRVAAGRAAADQLWVGLALAALLILLIRPLLVGVLIVPVRLRWGERAFVLWAGLKGAVPILLGIFIVDAGASDAARIYGIVFVVVLVSVVVQGGLVPDRGPGVRGADAGRRTRAVGPGHEVPGRTRRVAPDSRRSPGPPPTERPIADLDIGEHAWISMVSRHGHLVQVRGHTRLHAGDEVLVLADPDADLSRVFDGPAR